MIITMVVRVRVFDAWARWCGDAKCACHGSLALLLCFPGTCTLLAFVHLLTHLRKEDWGRCEGSGEMGMVGREMEMEGGWGGGVALKECQEVVEGPGPYRGSRRGSRGARVWMESLCKP